MKSYNRLTRLFLYAVWSVGLLTDVAAALWLPPDQRSPEPLGLSLILLLAFAAGSRTVTLTRSRRFAERCTISLGFFVTMLCLISFGPRTCVLVTTISALGSCIYPKRIPWHQTLFNISALTMSACAAAITYGALQRIAPETAFLRTMAAAGVYFLLNSGLLAAIISLCSAQRLSAVWRSTLWTAPSYLACAALAMLLQLLLPSWPATHTGLLLTLPVLAFLYQSYETHVNKLEESRRHLQQREQYIEELHQSQQRLTDLYASTVHCLACAIDAKDQGTHAHIHRVQKFAVAIAERMGIAGDELEAVRTGALLHDIGKLGVPDNILLKPGPLTDEEFRQMKQHCIIGAEILEPVHFPWPVIPIVKYHHERWDGKGYPEGLAGNDIPLNARIMMVADVYDALTSDRPYRVAWSPECALEYMREQAGIRFDPEAVEALIEIVAQVEPTIDAEAAANRLPERNRHAMQSIQRSTRKAGTLYEIARLLNAGLPFTERMERICQRTVAALPDTECAILATTVTLDQALCGRETPNKNKATAQDELLQVVASAGARGTEFCHAAFLGPAGLIARSMPFRKSASSDLVTAALTSVDAEESAPATCSFLIVPLVFAEQMIGAICLYHPEPGSLADDELYLLTVIAEQVQRDLYQQLQFQRSHDEAMTDPLTGLHNMRYLASPGPIIPAEPATAAALSYSVLYLDLDNFKPVNDTYGHAYGDTVLRDVAHLMQHALRPEDQIIRYGGDEFVVILPHTSPSEAAQVSRRLREAVQSYEAGRGFSRGEIVKLDVSIGAASYPLDGRDLHTLIAQADAAMYSDKSTHRRLPRLSHAAVNDTGIAEAI
jgi:diguanylate cyclase (GGDEF)-like protein/putative nucleotidyltransferase with HDIG domain